MADKTKADTMKVKTENFMIIDGARIPIGSELTVDRKYKGSVDMIGKRISTAVYDKYFKPKKAEKATKDEE